MVREADIRLWNHEETVWALDLELHKEAWSLTDYVIFLYSISNMIICYVYLPSCHSIQWNWIVMRAVTPQNLQNKNKITVKEVYMNHVLQSKPQSHTIAWKFSLPSQSRHHTRFDIKKAKYHWFLCLVSWHTNWKGRNVMKGKIYHKQLACLFHAHSILPSFMIPLWCFLVIFGAFSIIIILFTVFINYY